MRRDLTVMYGAQALRYLAPMILVPFYGRTLGIAAYGQLLSAMALMQIAWVVVEWGLPSTGLRDVATAQNESERARLVSEQISARLALAALVIPICLLVAVMVPALHTNLILTSLAAVLGVANAFNMTWYFQGRLQFRVAALVELGGLIVSTGLILVLVNAPEDAWLIPGTLLLISAISFFMQLRFSRESTPAVRLFLESPVSAIRASALLFVDRGQALLLGPVSILLLGFVAPAAQVAWFAIAERLLGVLIALLGPLNQVFSGMLARSVAQSRLGQPIQDTYHLMRKLAACSLGLYLLVSGAAFASADRLVPLIFGKGFAPVVPVFQILAVGLVILGMGGVLSSTVLYPLRHDREVALTSSVRLVSTLTFVTIAGALFGSHGAAYGRLLGGSAALGATIFMLKRLTLLAKILGRTDRCRLNDV